MHNAQFIIDNGQWIIHNAQLIIRMGICRTFGTLFAGGYLCRGFATLHPCLCS